MNENIQNAIDLALSGKINDMGNEIESALMQKVSDALAGKRMEVASSILTQNEEEEPVDDFEDEDDLDESSRTFTHAKKPITTIGDGVHSAKIYRDPQWKTYEVHYYKNGNHMGEKSISTHNWEDDAIANAKHTVKKLDKNIDESSINEKTMTSSEKAKEKKLKAKYDDSEMKAKMIKKYGPEKGESIYFATIRKQAMGESVEELDEISKKKIESYLDKAINWDGDSKEEGSAKKGREKGVISASLRTQGWMPNKSKRGTYGFKKYKGD